jgi:hypothetical protein
MAIRGIAKDRVACVIRKLNCVTVNRKYVFLSVALHYLGSLREFELVI